MWILWYLFLILFVKFSGYKNLIRCIALYKILLLLLHLHLPHGSLKEGNYSIIIFFSISLVIFLLYCICFAYLSYALKCSDHQLFMQSVVFQTFCLIWNFPENHFVADLIVYSKLCSPILNKHGSPDQYTDLIPNKDIQSNF